MQEQLISNWRWKDCLFFSVSFLFVLSVNFCNANYYTAWGKNFYVTYNPATPLFIEPSRISRSSSRTDSARASGNTIPFSVSTSFQPSPESSRNYLFIPRLRENQEHSISGIDYIPIDARSLHVYTIFRAISAGNLSPMPVALLLLLYWTRRARACGPGERERDGEDLVFCRGTTATC